MGIFFNEEKPVRGRDVDAPVEHWVEFEGAIDVSIDWTHKVKRMFWVFVENSILICGMLMLYVIYLDHFFLDRKLN